MRLVARRRPPRARVDGGRRVRTCCGTSTSGASNTVFKLYLQVWVLWALAAAVSVGPSSGGGFHGCGAAVRDDLAASSSSSSSPSRRLYPILAARAKIDDRFDTIGRAHARRGRLHANGGVHTTRTWRCSSRTTAMRSAGCSENVDGSPVVVEANTTPTLYGWEGRYSDLHGQSVDRRLGLPPAPAAAAAERRRCSSVSRTSRAPTGRPTRPPRYRDPLALRRVVCRRRPARARVLPGGHGEVGRRATGRYWDVAYANPGVRIYRVAVRRPRPSIAVVDDRLARAEHGGAEPVELLRARGGVVAPLEATRRRRSGRRSVRAAALRRPRSRVRVDPLHVGDACARVVAPLDARVPATSDHAREGR